MQWLDQREEEKREEGEEEKREDGEEEKLANDTTPRLKDLVLKFLIEGLILTLFSFYIIILI